MADVQTLLARKADNTYPLSPWLDPSFNTCILDPTPQIDDMLDTAVAEEAQQVGTQVGDAKDCLWEKVGDAIFNKNQGGQVLVNTKDPSSKGATFTASRDAEAGSTSKVSEIRNTAFALDMTGTGSMLFWTFKHPEVEGQAVAGGVTIALESNWTLTRYVDFQYFLHAGTLGTGPDNYWGPEGICSDGTFVYVCDTLNHRIKKAALADLTFVTMIGSVGSGNDQFHSPRDIFCSGEHLYIADRSNNRIMKRKTSDLSYVAKYGTDGTGDDNLKGPCGVACDGTYVYVSDTTNNRIVKRLASDLSYVAQIGSYGSGNDQFSSPAGLFTDGTYLWVTDYGNNRIMVRFCADLSYAGKFGSVGTGDGQFTQAYDVAVSNNYIYVADTGNNRIQKFARSDYSFQSKYGSLGSGVDNLNNPWSLYVAENLLYISDEGNHRVMVRAIVDDISTYFLEFSTYLGFSVAKKGIVKEVGRFTSDGYLALGQPVATERLDIVGNARISGQYISWLPTGTMPVNVQSTTMCTNLNADMVDGVHFASLTPSRIVVTDTFGIINVNAALTAPTFPYASGSGSLADSAFYRVSASVYSIGGAAGVTDPATWQFTVWNPASANVVLGVCQDTAAYYADIGLRNAGGDITWIWSLRASVASPTPYALECWYHNGTSWASPAYLRIAPDGVVTCTVSLTIASLSGILIATAGAVTAITDNHANWDTAYGWGNHAIAGYLTSVTPHNILSATHGDTTAASVVRGDMMIGVGATPKWERLADVAAGAYFRSGGVALEPLWSTLILPNAGTIYRLPVFSAANTMTELAAVGATGEYLKGNTGAIPSWATLNQAAVAGLTTIDGPSFAHVHATDAPATGGALITAAESWIGPSAATGIYFKTGNVGIGTTDPLSKVDVAGTTGITWGAAANSLGLVTVGTGGTVGGSLFVNTPSVQADYHSGLGITGTYGTPTFRSVININAYGVKSGGYDPSGYGSDMALSTTNGTTLYERMRITSVGTVLINATAAIGTEKLYVNGSIYSSTDIKTLKNGSDSVGVGPTFGLGSLTGTAYYHMWQLGAAGGLDLHSYDGASWQKSMWFTVARLVYNYSNSAHWDVTSDERAKKKISPYNLGLKELLQLQPKSFEFNGKMGTEDGKKGFGLVAQDVEKIIPEAIHRSKAKMNKDDTDEVEMLSLSIGDHVHYMLINSVKELEARLRKLGGA